MIIFAFCWLYKILPQWPTLCRGVKGHREIALQKNAIIIVIIVIIFTEFKIITDHRIPKTQSFKNAYRTRKYGQLTNFWSYFGKKKNDADARKMMLMPSVNVPQIKMFRERWCDVYSNNSACCIKPKTREEVQGLCYTEQVLSCDCCRVIIIGQVS